MATTTLGGFGSVSSAPARSVIPQAAIFQHTHVAGVVEGDTPSMYVPYVGSRTAAQIVAEGAEITEGDTKAKELAIQTQKLAVLNVFTNESGLQASGEGGYIGGNGPDVIRILTDGIYKSIMDKANALLWQNPAPTEGAPEARPTGLFNYPGIIQGGNITDRLDPIIDAIAQVSANGGTPTALIMGYGTWSYLLKMRYAEGQPVISPDVANAPTPTLFGINVYLDPMAPDGKILINSTGEVYSAVGQIKAARTDDRYFERDSFGVRVTLRMGWGVPYPDRLAVVTVNQPADTGKPGK